MRPRRPARCGRATAGPAPRRPGTERTRRWPTGPQRQRVRLLASLSARARAPQPPHSHAGARRSRMARTRLSRVTRRVPHRAAAGGAQKGAPREQGISLRPPAQALSPPASVFHISTPPLAGQSDARRRRADDARPTRRDARGGRDTTIKLLSIALVLYFRLKRVSCTVAFAYSFRTRITHVARLNYSKQFHCEFCACE